MILGGHWIPRHMWQEDIDWFASLDNTWILIVDYDVEHIHRLYSKNKSLSFILRDHSLSEQHDAMKRDPVATAREHVQSFSRRLDKLYEDAGARGHELPPRSRFVFLGINEPHVWTNESEVIKYTEALLQLATEAGIRIGALNLSVGWPANSGRDTPVNWSKYKRIAELILGGNHFLSLHEYWPYDGVGYQWGWLAGRFTQCPFNVPIMITEAGVDNYVKQAVENFDERGWQANLSPKEYAEQLHDYISRCSNDNRIVVVTPFTSDYGGPEWKSFNMREAYGAMRELDWNMHNVWIPIAPTEPEESKDRKKVELSIYAPVDDNYVLTQRFGENPDWYKPYKGHMGIDYGCPVGTPVFACDNGVVVENGSLPQEGNYIKIRHSWGESVYTHLSDTVVSVNDNVAAKSRIAYSGNTGRSTGPHLHFAIRIFPYNRADGWNGYVDPLPYIRAVNYDDEERDVYTVTIPAESKKVEIVLEGDPSSITIVKKNTMM